MKNVVVVNGEGDWAAYLPGYAVYQTRLQTSRWLWHDGHLYVIDSAGTVRVDGVLWRVGAIRPRPAHRAVLEMIRMAGVACVNPARALLLGFDRLGMLNELREAGLPVINCSVAVGDSTLDRIIPTLPAVIKAGNYHGGLGKARPVDEEQWNELRDLLFATEDYFTIEPYIDYVRDIRCLIAGDRLWAMARRGVAWKANVRTASYELITVPDEIGEYTALAQRHLGADVLGLDFLETLDGRFVLLESNDVPGLSGFPDDVRQAIALRLRIRMEALEG